MTPLRTWWRPRGLEGGGCQPARMDLHREMLSVAPELTVTCSLTCRQRWSALGNKEQKKQGPREGMEVCMESKG